MKKYYFIAYTTSTTKGFGGRVVGSCVMEVVNMSLPEIRKYIQETNNFENPVELTCLTSITKKEYKMLGGLNKNTNNNDGEIIKQ